MRCQQTWAWLLGSAPFTSRSSTTASFPASDAMWSAVFPLCREQAWSCKTQNKHCFRSTRWTGCVKHLIAYNTLARFALQITLARETHTERSVAEFTHYNALWRTNWFVMSKAQNIYFLWLNVSNQNRMSTKRRKRKRSQTSNSYLVHLYRSTSNTRKQNWRFQSIFMKCLRAMPAFPTSVHWHPINHRNNLHLGSSIDRRSSVEQSIDDGAVTFLGGEVQRGQTALKEKETNAWDRQS